MAREEPQAAKGPKARAKPQKEKVAFAPKEPAGPCRPASKAEVAAAAARKAEAKRKKRAKSPSERDERRLSERPAFEARTTATLAERYMVQRRYPGELDENWTNYPKGHPGAEAEEAVQPGENKESKGAVEATDELGMAAEKPEKGDEAKEDKAESSLGPEMPHGTREEGKEESDSERSEASHEEVPEHQSLQYDLAQSETDTEGGDRAYVRPNRGISGPYATPTTPSSGRSVSASPESAARIVQVGTAHAVDLSDEESEVAVETAPTNTSQP